MTPLDALSAEDVRTIFLLVNEVRELGETSFEWRRHCAYRLRQLLGGRVVLDGETLLHVASAQQFFQAGHMGYADREREVCLGLFQAPDPRLPDPIWSGLERFCAMDYTLLRHDFIEDAAWNRSAFINEVRRAFGLEDALFSRRRLHAFGCSHMLAFHRSRDDRPFGRREQQMLSLFHDELQRAFSVRVPHPGYQRLTPALTEALLALRGDASEKQAADALHIGTATLHERAKRLYRLFNVHSRPELVRATAAYFNPLRPRLEAEHRKAGEPVIFEYP